MNNRATKKFWKYFDKIPKGAQRQAEKSFEFWKKNPEHPSLNFEQVHPVKPYYSIRTSQKYRAVSIKKENTLFWFWIGSHNDYEKLIGGF